MADQRSVSDMTTAADAVTEAIRAKNSLRIIIAAFFTVLFSFLMLLIFFAELTGTAYRLETADVIAIFGAITSIVGTIVGAYFGVSAANGARDAAVSQSKNASDRVHQAMDQVT